MTTPDVALPAELVPLSWLIGSWVGVGIGGYHNVPEFRFGQEANFSCDGRPFLSYWSRSWLLDAAGQPVRPLAMETGFWRPQPNNQVEVVLAHPSGYAEVWVGEVAVTELADAMITGAKVELRTDIVARTVTAKEYNAGQRLFGLVQGDLLWAYDMAAMGQPLTSHVSARLKRA